MRSPSRVYRRLFKKHIRKSRKRLVRYSLLAANMALLVVVIGFVSGSPAANEVNRQNALAAPDDGTAAANPLDQLSSADIAVHVALLTGLDETVAVVNHADSVNAQLTVAPTEESVVAKPQIVATALKSKKDIVKYTAEEGDSVSKLASKFGVTSDSIRWSNGLTGNELEAGQDLYIPPVNGIVYTVKSGDTIDSLVARYSADKQKLIQMNDAELGGLKVGDRIIIADGVQPQPRVSFSYSTFRWGSISPRYGGNGYDYGWCTWHAANRRIEAGRPLPNNLGNAISWYYLAQRAGLSVGTRPRAGAVLWHANMGGLGHVAYVEKENADGSFLVSDMNYIGDDGRGGWGTVSRRTIHPGEFHNYRFIY